MEEKNMAYYLEDLNRVHHLSFEKLGEWKEKFPYAQAVHFLMAKKHQLEGFVDDMSVYHKASFYAVDRAFLQDRMTRSETEIENDEFVPVVESISEESVIEEVEVKDVAIEKAEIAVVEVSDSSENPEQLSDFAMWLNGLDPINEENNFKREPKKKKKKKKNSKLAKKIEASIIKQDEIISEPLAQILAQQGHVDKAKLMYEKLSLIFPEKSSFFALQIEKLINSK